MMHDYIEKQLKKCRVADIPPYDVNTTTLIIKKKDVKGISPSIGKCYIAELLPPIFDSPDMQTIHTNWNRGIAPTDNFMKCEVLAVMGNMIKINGVGYLPESDQDLTTLWEGWLPLNDVRFIKEI